MIVRYYKKIKHKKPIKKRAKPFYSMDKIEFTSQWGQDKWMVSELNLIEKPFKGFFVELGAVDGIHLSNTYVMEKYFDWNGICIEPCPETFLELQENRKCSTDNSLIYGEKNKEVEFSFWNSRYHSLSGIENHVYFWKNSSYRKNIKLKTELLANILNKYNAPKLIHFLSLDVEGAELNILKTFPFDKYKIIYICVERGQHSLGIKNFLCEQGYDFIRKIRKDDIYKLINIKRKYWLS